MEEHVKSKLQNGEQILWSGTPDNVKLMEKPFGVSIIIRWVVAAIFLVLAVWYAGHAAATEASGKDMALMLGVMLLVVAYLFLEPLYLVARLKNKTFYCVTNLRVIACYKARPMVLKFRMLNEVEEISVESLSTGCSTIYFGHKNKRGVKLARAQHAVSELQEQEEELPLSLYSVKDVEAVLKVLPARLCN